MPMFPDITPPDFGSQSGYYHPQRKTAMSDGRVRSAKKFSRGRRTLKMTWAALSEEEYQILEQFFEETVGGSFDWVDPITDKTYTFVFVGDTLDSTPQKPGFRSVSVGVEEI